MQDQPEHIPADIPDVESLIVDDHLAGVVLHEIEKPVKWQHIALKPGIYVQIKRPNADEIRDYAYIRRILSDGKHISIEYQIPDVIVVDPLFDRIRVRKISIALLQTHIYVAPASNLIKPIRLLKWDDENYVVVTRDVY